jgi:hypothetical protein
MWLLPKYLTKYQGFKWETTETRLITNWQIPWATSKGPCRLRESRVSEDGKEGFSVGTGTSREAGRPIKMVTSMVSVNCYQRCVFQSQKNHGLRIKEWTFPLLFRGLCWQDMFNLIPLQWTTDFNLYFFGWQALSGVVEYLLKVWFLHFPIRYNIRNHNQ